MPSGHPTYRLKPAPAGFTLVELLTVIAIVCVLAAMLQPIIETVRRQAHKSRTLALFGNVDNAFQQYKEEYGRYPIFKELGATATPWSTNKNEIDTTFQLNDGDAILRRVLCADNKYLIQASTPGAVNYNRHSVRFLELDETYLNRDKTGTTASTNNPWIQDGFKNVYIGVVVHTGDSHEIESSAFTSAKPVPDADDNGPLLPKVVHNLPQLIAIYSLVQNLNDDPVNSTWVTNWNYDQYNR